MSLNFLSANHSLLKRSLLKPSLLKRSFLPPGLARPGLARPDLTRRDLARPGLARPDLARRQHQQPAKALPALLLSSLLLVLQSTASATTPVRAAPEHVATAPATFLSLSEALSLSLQHHASLAVFPYAQRQAQARELQASLRPAPSLSLSAENILGSGDSRALHGAELTLAVSQLFEADGKRDSRLALAKADSAQQALRYQLTATDVLAQTRQHYLQLLQLQALQQLALTEQQLIREALTMAETRVKAGAIASSDLLRLQSRQLQNRLSQQQLAHNISKASADLAALWGRTASFSRVSGDLSQLPALPALAALQQALSQAPQLQVWLSEVRLAQSAQQLAIANSGRDISVSAGVRHNALSNDNSLLLAISVPLFSQAPNAGDIAETNARYSETLWHNERQLQQLQLAVRQRLLQLKQLQQYLHDLQTALLPLQQKMVAAVQQNYQAGLVDIYGLLSAQQELLDSQRQLIEGQSTFHSQLIELQRLTGLSLTVDGPRQLPAASRHFGASS